MENYGFELVVGGLVGFSVTLFIGCVCICTRKTEKVNNNHNEIESLEVTLQEIIIEKKEVENGMIQRINQINALELPQTSLPFFKPANENQSSFKREKLQELHCNLITELNNYPKFSGFDAKNKDYLEDFHKQNKEHHGRVVLTAEECFNRFDEYLHDFNHAKTESSKLIAGGSSF